MVWADVPADKEDDFNRWYNEEYMAERLAIPGFLSAARYETVTPGAPKHLAVYEVENIGVFDSDRVQACACQPDRVDAARRAAGGRDNVHTQHLRADISVGGDRRRRRRSGMAPALQIGRMTVPQELDDEWNEWYNSVYVPNYMKVPGCIRGRRYRAVVGEPKYATVYELDRPDLSQTAEWLRQRAIHPDNDRWQQTMQHAQGSPGVWVKTFELE